MIKTLRLLLPLLLLVGCVSAPEHIVLTEPPASLAFPDGNGQAEIVVVRKGISAFAVRFGINVNGKAVGSLGPNDFARALVDPGEVLVKARAEATCTATFPVEANRSYYLSASPRMGWGFARVQLGLLDPEKGQAQREKCDDQTFGASAEPDE